MADEKLNMKGHITFTHIRNGEVIDVREIDNAIMNVGKAEMAGLMLTDIGGTAFDYIAIGTGTGGDATATTLVTESTTNGGERRGGEDVDGTRVTTTVTNDTAQLVTTFAFTDAIAITESGIFNAAENGTMLARQTFDVINVNDGDTLQLTWKIQFS